MHAPVKKKVVRANEAPYMTKALRKAIANRFRLENQYYRKKTDDSKMYYIKQRNFCSRLYKKERKKFYANLDTKNVTDNKRFWKNVKPFLSDKGLGKSDITLIEGNRIISDDLDVANTLNSFFDNVVSSLGIGEPMESTTVLSSLTDSIDGIIQKYSNHPSIININQNVFGTNFSFHETTMSDVENELRKLDTNKACMPNSIPAKALKENSCICSLPLTNIFNNEIKTSFFDDGLKYANITPIYKSDDATDKKNYRPIGVLPVVSKIFETIMLNQISFYTDKFLSPFLCGYRKGYNAQHALLSLLDKWHVSLDNKGFGGALLMDLSKAFDTLNHDLLIAKLHAYGFDKNALKLIVPLYKMAKD